MISEGSCETEDWSNDPENPALHHDILKYIKIERSCFKFKNISQYYCFCCIFDQINADNK